MLFFFYIGERITLKDNNLVYYPGNSQDSSLYSVINSSKLVNYDIIIKKMSQ